MARISFINRNNPLIFYIKRSLCTQAIKPKLQVTLEQSIDQALETGQYKPRRHEGRLVTGCVTVPTNICNAIVRSCKDHPLKALVSEGAKLDNVIRSRKIPLEPDELRKKINDVRHQIGREFQEKLNVEAMSEEQITYMNSLVESQSKKKAKQQIYAWKPMVYDEFKSLQYLLGRSAQEFAALVRILEEIKQRDQHFKPRSFIDFGSGVGTGTWAASNLWKEHIFEYVSIDASADMNELAELILRGGEMNKEISLRNVFYRQFLPATATKYDLVLSAFTLFELPSRRNRLEVLENLWNKCDKYLVIVEQGTYAGFSLINEARDFLLKQSKKTDESCHIFSPCPHSEHCPRFTLDDGTPCNFEVTYNSLSTGAKGVSKANKFLYSYVVFRKGTPTGDQISYPRLVRPTLVRSRHAVCRMCSEAGSLQEIIFTSSKHGKNLYRCAKASKWGDLLPIKIGDES
ncbi:methyltransferase-like protein 17, mitochondrial [Uranotaenia lowii]|uniref:methyltransferase-like protein 17, mitochondrial n=1 Tax=Uranotaenia lowii TaxID=190385 RepID=UPI002479627F|nr:methyltransferase-like protein 17, mitochondrial [Uranotaenia lowii]